MDDERLARPTGRWEAAVDEQAAMASSYRERGWQAFELHPGDVSIRAGTGDDDRFGFDVVVPGAEFDDLRAIVEDGVTFDSYELYGDVESSMAVVVVAMESAADEVAVVYPLYYTHRTLEGVRDRVDEEGALYTHVRPLDRHAVVTFTHEEPSLFFREDE